MAGNERGAAANIGLLDLAKALPQLAPQAASMATAGLGLLTLGTNTRDSVGHLFQRLAARHPSRVFLRFGDRDLTYGEANAQVNRYASVLSGYGVGNGSVVGILATNRPETLLVALSVVKLGGIAGMLNYRQREETLNHSLRLLDSTVTVVGAECHDALESLPEPINGPVLGLANSGSALPDRPDLDAAAAVADDGNPEQCARVRAGSKAFYIFTSGTSGLPKASTMSHLRWLKGMHAFGKLGVRLRYDDTLYCCLPLYHNNAITVSLASVLSVGATLALGESFSASRFWDEVIRTRATAFCYIGEICRYLLSQPEREADRQHQIRVAFGNGLQPDIWSRFKHRFGIERIAEFYGASECNLVFINALNFDATAGTCPAPFAVVEYDPGTEEPLRDSAGKLRRVGKGGTGLLLTKVTSRFPFDGYTDPAATEKKLVRGAFKTGDAWFNTGDLVRDQGFNHVVFVDRLGDTFRWKGENVATTEVEAAINERADVEQSVVYGVEIPGTSGKAGMAAIKLAPGTDFDGQALAAHLSKRLPDYAVPLFVRLVESVEQTTTFKIRKTDLRDEGYDTSRFNDPLYVLDGGQYIPAYASYADDVAAGRVKV